MLKYLSLYTAGAGGVLFPVCLEPHDRGCPDGGIHGAGWTHCQELHPAGSSTRRLQVLIFQLLVDENLAAAAATAPATPKARTTHLKEASITLASTYFLHPPSYVLRLAVFSLSWFRNVPQASENKLEESLMWPEDEGKFASVILAWCWEWWPKQWGVAHMMGSEGVNGGLRHRGFFRLLWIWTTQKVKSLLTVICIVSSYWVFSCPAM